MEVLAHRLKISDGIAITVHILKVIASLGLALAYVPKFGVSAREGDHYPAVDNNAENGHLPPKGTDESTENDDEEDEDEPKRHTAYDWPAILLRLKRIMPLILPRKSRLAYVLIGKLSMRR